MSVHLNDLSKVYLNNILESSCEDDEPKMKKSKKKNNEVDDEKEEDDDEIEESKKPNDGNLANNYPPYDQITRGDVIAGRLGKDQMGGKKKKKITTEGFSNWRNDLIEVIEPERLPSKMKEGKIDNYNGKNKCVTINPEVKEQVQILESFELSEEYITETVNGAVDYFMEEGINEDGLEIIIDELGIEEFVSFVFEIGNEVLTEARTLLGKKKNPQKLPKGTAPTTLTKAAVAKYGTTRKFKSPSTSGVVKKNRPAAKAVEKAKETQTSKKPVRDAIARGVFGVVKAYQAGMERHKKAMNLAKETGKTVAKAASVTHEAGRRAGQSKVGQAVKKVGSAAIKAGVEKAKKDIKSLKKEEVEIDEQNQGPSTPVKSDPKMGIVPNLGAGRPGKVRLKKQYEVDENLSILDEKATSEQQQKLFGLALSVKRGETPRSEASDEVLKIVDSMSEKKIRDFAKTKHEGIPKKVEEELDPTTPQQIAAQKKLATAQDLVNKANKKALSQKQKSSTKETEIVSAGYELEGEVIDERRREDKGTPRPPEPSAAFKAVSSMIKKRQQPKVPGKKPPVAGQYGAPKSPAQKVALRRAAEIRSQEMQNS